MKLDHKEEQHLSQDQLIRAVVDVTDLPPSAQAHLAACDQCLADKNSFELGMVKLGQKAERLVPKPQRRISLPAAKSKNILGNFLQWRSWTAAAATVTAIFILVWGTNIARNRSEPGSENLTADIIEAERLMTEVNTLVDNALPPLSGRNILSRRNHRRDDKNDQ